MQKKELEIMAPAGGFDCLQAAIQGGANSVYFGIGHLNMRSHSAGNFTREDLPEIMRICRESGVKAYMTLNITLYEEDLQAAYDTLDAAKAVGVDAIIASDMACISYCRRIGLDDSFPAERRPTISAISAASVSIACVISKGGFFMTRPTFHYSTIFTTSSIKNQYMMEDL